MLFESDASEAFQILPYQHSTEFYIFTVALIDSRPSTMGRGLPPVMEGLRGQFQRRQAFGRIAVFLGLTRGVHSRVWPLD